MSIRAGKTRRLVRSLSRQGGFTLVSMFMSFTIGAVVLTGAWMAYTSMQAQMHVQNADRQMDQYAHAAFQELTNLLSWSWAGVQVQGGSQHTRWKFLIKDVPQEYGTVLKYHTDGLGFLFVSFHPSRGILINGNAPSWAEDRFREMYIFLGQAPRHNQINVMDRRDRMSVEGMTIDHSGSRFVDQLDPIEVAGARGTVTITMTMQYRYEAGALFGLYPEEYVRERIYSTQIYMRNWDSEVNEFRKQWMESQVGGGGA